MITRLSASVIMNLLKGFPAVAIIGPRQVGKTTLAKMIRTDFKDSIYLDLELRNDFEKLEDAETYLKQFETRMVIIDEIQRKKELFPILRALIDQNRRPGRFLLLGSAAPELLRNSSESLAGRIAYHELTPFIIPEVYPEYKIDELWLKGGFPDPFLHENYWLEWMNNFTRTYFERDLINLGFPGNSIMGQRLWTMLAHLHGNPVKFSELSKSLEKSIHTVKNYIDFLENAFLIRMVRPFHSNTKKRLVKAPKVYIRDSGLMHYLSGIENKDQLLGHPKMGSSWEGFVIEQIIPLLKPNYKAWFYRTHDGAELDLVITKADRPVAGIEIKYGSGIKPSRGNTEAVNYLKTHNNFIIVINDEDFILNEHFKVAGLSIFIEKYLPEI